MKKIISLVLALSFVFAGKARAEEPTTQCEYEYCCDGATACDQKCAEEGICFTGQEAEGWVDGYENNAVYYNDGPYKYVEFSQASYDVYGNLEQCLGKSNTKLKYSFIDNTESTDKGTCHQTGISGSADLGWKPRVSGKRRIFKCKCSEEDKNNPPSLSGDTTFSNEKEAILTIQGGKGPFNDRNLILSGKENENGEFVSYYTANIIEEGEGENKTYKVKIPAQDFNTDCGLKLKVVDACGNESEEVTVINDGGDWELVGGPQRLGPDGKDVCNFTSSRGDSISIEGERGVVTRGDQMIGGRIKVNNYVYFNKNHTSYTNYQANCDGWRESCLVWECSDFGASDDESGCCKKEDGPTNYVYYPYPSARYVYWRIDDCQPPQLPKEETMEKSCVEGEISEARQCLCWDKEDLDTLNLPPGDDTSIEKGYQELMTKKFKPTVIKKDLCEAFIFSQIQEKICRNGEFKWEPDDVDSDTETDEFKCTCVARKTKRKSEKNIPTPFPEIPESIEEINKKYNFSDPGLEKWLEDLVDFNYKRNYDLYLLDYCAGRNMEHPNPRIDIYNGFVTKITEEGRHTEDFFNKTNSFKGSAMEILEQIFNEVYGRIYYDYFGSSSACNIVKDSEQVLSSGAGSCRDFKTLFIEAAKRNPKLQEMGIEIFFTSVEQHGWADLVFPNGVRFFIDPTNQQSFGAIAPFNIPIGYPNYPFCQGHPQGL